MLYLFFIAKQYSLNKMVYAIGNGLTFLALGIASLVISLQNPANCGSGLLDVQTYVFATGIAYTIIGVCSGIAGVLLILTVIGAIPVLIVLVFSGLFTFIWMIMGSVFLWRDGAICIDTNFMVWQMAMADVIITIVIVVTSGFGYRATAEQE